MKKNYQKLDKTGKEERKTNDRESGGLRNKERGKKKRHIGIEKQ